MNLDFKNIFFGLIFGGIGFLAWKYGRKNQSMRHMSLGFALMGYSYLIPNPWYALLTGAVLTGLLFWP